MTPLRISFAVLDQIERYTLSAQGRVIILQCSPIDPTNASNRVADACKLPGRPTQGRCVGMLQNGKLIQFVLPLHVYEKLCRHPVSFVEATAVAPIGGLVDFRGRLLQTG